MQPVRVIGVEVGRYHAADVAGPDAESLLLDRPVHWHNGRADAGPDGKEIPPTGKSFDVDFFARRAVQAVPAYATVRVYKGSAELADALVESEGEVKLLRTADGATSISVYEDENGADESTRAAGARLRDNLPRFSVAAPEVSAREVAISRRRSGRV